MIINTSVTVSFLIPEESEMAEEFKTEQDMNEWKESLCSWCVTYTKKSIISADYESVERREHGSRFKPTF